VRIAQQQQVFHGACRCDEPERHTSTGEQRLILSADLVFNAGRPVDYCSRYGGIRRLGRLFQWRTAQQKASLDLFERRHAIYEIVRKAVGQMVASSTGFDQTRELELMDLMERTIFSLGMTWKNTSSSCGRTLLMCAVWMPSYQRQQIPILVAVVKRRAALDRISKFYTTGQPLFARYMRFSQTVRGF
jgi:hypothetical protein